MTNSPRIYVGTYKKYNEGSLEGAWLTPSDYDSHEDFIDACLKLHADEPDCELMFQDTDNLPDEFYCECSFSEEAFDYCKRIEGMDDEECEAYRAYCELFHDTDVDSFRDHYYGWYDSHYDLGYSLYEEGAIEIPENLTSYFDFEAYGRDCSFDFAEIDGYYFWN